jgi:hypothetical protein
LGYTVEELLSRISSYELAEWEAYERANGPLGNDYMNEALASLHEAIQLNTFVIGMGYGDENPVEKPIKYPRPTEVFKPPPEEDQGDLTIHDEI